MYTHARAYTATALEDTDLLVLDVGAYEALKVRALCLCVCVCVYVCMYVCVYVCACACALAYDTVIYYP